jgi:hypothetical protein
LVLVGPILRQCTANRLVIWMAVREPIRFRLHLRSGQETLCELSLAPDDSRLSWLHAGKHLHYALLDIPLGTPLPTDTWIAYGLELQTVNTASDWLPLESLIPHLCYPGQSRPGFVQPAHLNGVLHGSCRKPHHDGGDGLVHADQWLASLWDRQGDDDKQAEVKDVPARWPGVLIMSGDQIYADDVAGPVLHAIHQVIDLLGLPDEPLPAPESAAIGSASELYEHEAGFYARQTLLPSKVHHYDMIETVFGGVEKPVFTSDNAHNHLISLAEVLAMYLLVWSPTLWSHIRLDRPAQVKPQDHKRYRREQAQIEQFVKGLPAVQRVLAHLPTAMIFDDHDISDDWNLSREWEEVAYGHSFSRRVLGNALIGYLIHQGWGNEPQAFAPGVLDAVQDSLNKPGLGAHDQAIDALLAFDQWHYTWSTSPPLVVIDTRTHRWRSESAARKPSGLLDWEALTDLQQTLKGLPAVILVSPAPIFGVKLIEVIQRLFTWFGKPLMVDAENWMAHPGTAHAILNVFQHPKTPQHFVVLSGDVHYSFAYDVELRRHATGPDIWQICSSGLRNTFPDRLLKWLDIANRWLYSPRSPLNWFTRRRRMRITPRKPQGTEHGRRLLNGSGVGLVELDAKGVPIQISQLLSHGRRVQFIRHEDEARWQ